MKNHQHQQKLQQQLLLMLQEGLTHAQAMKNHQQQQEKGNVSAETATSVTALKTVANNTAARLQQELTLAHADYMTCLRASVAAGEAAARKSSAETFTDSGSDSGKPTTLVTAQAAAAVNRYQLATAASKAAGDAMTCRQLHDEEAWLLLDTIIGPVAGEGLEQALDTTRFGKKAVRRLGSGTTTTSPEEAEEGKHAFLPCSTMPRFKARMEEAGEAAYVQMESSFRETGGWPSVSQVAVRIQLLLHDMPQDGAKPLDRTHMLKLQATYPSLRHDPRGAGKPGRSSKPGSRYVRPEHAEILTELDERMSQAVRSSRAQLITAWKDGAGWPSLANQSLLQLNYLFHVLPSPQ
ncbi:MAG: hypothetical protein WDW38_007455 [Sanguina aurantia]